MSPRLDVPKLRARLSSPRQRLDPGLAAYAEDPVRFERSAGGVVLRPCVEVLPQGDVQSEGARRLVRAYLHGLSAIEQFAAERPQP